MELNNKQVESVKIEIRKKFGLKAWETLDLIEVSDSCYIFISFNGGANTAFLVKPMETSIRNDIIEKLDKELDVVCRGRYNFGRHIIVYFEKDNVSKISSSPDENKEAKWYPKKTENKSTDWLIRRAS